MSKGCIICQQQFDHKGTKCNKCVCKISYYKNRSKRLEKAKEYRLKNKNIIALKSRSPEALAKKRIYRSNDPLRFEKQKLEYLRNRCNRLKSAKKYREKNPGKVKKAQRDYRLSDAYKQKRREDYKLNKNKCRDKNLERCKKNSILNKEKNAKRQKIYRAKPEIKERNYIYDVLSGRRSERLARRRLSIKRAIPSWLSKEQLNKIIEIYKNRPNGYHVDHIIPLNGKNVSGLHVPWNLQYLTIEDNLKKGNSYG